MIELYYWPTPNGHKITMFLEEAGLEYAIHPVDISAGDQFKPDFLAISPNNRMPAIIDTAPADGGEPISVFESGAILLYLAEKTGRFLPKDVRGRKATTAEVVLRMLLLKHVRDWSYEVLTREVRANLVYREFTRVGGEKVPDDRTMGNLARQLGPEVIEKLHRRVVEIAQENKIATGRKMRVDTTVVETDIHYPTDSTLLGDGVRVLTRIMKKVTAVAGKAGTQMRDRSRSAKLRVFGDCARQPEQDGARPAEDEERLCQTAGNHQPGRRASQEVFERDRRGRQARQPVRPAQGQAAVG